MRVKPIWNNWKPAKKDRWRREYNMPSHKEWPELYEFAPGEHWCGDLFYGRDLYLLKPEYHVEMPGLEVLADTTGKYDDYDIHDERVKVLNAAIRKAKRQRSKKAHPANNRRSA